MKYNLLRAKNNFALPFYLFMQCICLNLNIYVGLARPFILKNLKGHSLPGI
ncbi:hypothetical protein Metho_0343 [Methanomethylovorans hollandica DSM 15978]|uniref:Uncharacterized protein n=1 Tax=Methanomethylovorans hollandica (strain DSM 15978 / NBRC 107637 / DMS1) TaxID=867904 RepID=L0KU19_METHD|nr:hypothetical protein Metho_0343 [Methanomethylovorans hollandica DSM 15978]